MYIDTHTIDLGPRAQGPGPRAQGRGWEGVMHYTWGGGLMHWLAAAITPYRYSELYQSFEPDGQQALRLPPGRV